MEGEHVRGWRVLVPNNALKAKKIVVRAAQAATQFQVSAEGRAAARLPDIEAHVTYDVAGMGQQRTPYGPSP